MKWETSAQHISLVIEGEEIIPLISPPLGGLALDKCKVCGRDHATKDHPYIYEGMELPTKPKPKIVFGRDVLCPSCRGTGKATPMHTGEKAERARAQKRKQPMPMRWECDRCGGSGLANVND